MRTITSLIAEKRTTYIYARRLLTRQNLWLRTDSSNGMLTVFQVLSGENWNEAMYDGIRTGQVELSVVFFVSMVVLGNFILFNLFLAMLLGAFDGQSEETGDTICKGPPLLTKARNGLRYTSCSVVKLVSTGNVSWEMRP